MQRSCALRSVLLNRLFRCVRAAAGLMIAASGSFLQLQAALGLNPWNMLNEGLSLSLPLTFGQASIAISMMVICVDLIMRESIGLGTILDALVVGWTFDFLLWLEPIPVQTSLPFQLFFMLLGCFVLQFGNFVYMGAGLSCGPRDAFLVGIGKRFPKVPIGRVNMAITGIVLVGGMLLGSKLGFGTFFNIFGGSIIMDLVFGVLHFEPRSVQHENLIQTIAAISAAHKADRAAVR